MEIAFTLASIARPREVSRARLLLDTSIFLSAVAAVVWAIILVGMFVGRRNILGENARSVLSALTFFVASPALLFDTLSKAQQQRPQTRPAK